MGNEMIKVTCSVCGIKRWRKLNVRNRQTPIDTCKECNRSFWED